MTDKETLNRIEKDAHDFTEGWAENCDIRSYIAGAKSERNHVLDEVITIAKSKTTLIIPMGDFIQQLESLKL